MVSYTAPLVVLAALCLLVFFKEVPIGKNLKALTNVFSASAFAVYLIHSNVRVYWQYVEAVKPLGSMDGRQLLLWLPVTIIVVYLGCTAIDTIRAFLFRKCGIDQLVKKVDGIALIKELEE